MHHYQKYDALIQLYMGNLGKQFKAFRKSKGINQTNLSIWSGLSRSTIWRFENDKCEIKSGSFEKLLNAVDGKVIIIDKNL